jgi:hypothetical protein
MKRVLAVASAAALVAFAVWLFWPAKPLQTCEDFLSSSVADCDMTKGHVK